MDEQGVEPVIAMAEPRETGWAADSRRRPSGRWSRRAERLSPRGSPLRSDAGRRRARGSAVGAEQSAREDNRKCPNRRKRRQGRGAKVPRPRRGPGLPRRPGAETAHALVADGAAGLPHCACAAPPSSPSSSPFALFHWRVRPG